MRYLIFLLLFTNSIVKSKLIDRCGNYYVEGYYTKIKSALHDWKNKRVVLIERGTNSEIKFYPQNKNLEKLIPDTLIGVSFKLELKFSSSCWYHCEGEIVKIIAPLEPFTSTQSFLFPKPKPIKGTEKKCLINSIDKRKSSVVSISPVI